MKKIFICSPYRGDVESNTRLAKKIGRIAALCEYVPVIPHLMYYAFRVFHAGMATPVPVANGGTGASTAKAALNNLGIFYSATLPSSGTDGQICLVPV